MSFFQRVAGWLFNKVLVEKLSESHAFQQFAVSTHAAFKQAQGAVDSAKGVVRTAMNEAVNDAKAKLAEIERENLAKQQMLEREKAREAGKLNSRAQS